MSVEISRARPEDVDELLKLYFIVYGSSYPISLGSDRTTMEHAISSRDYLWFVARDQGGRRIASSLVFEVDSLNRIAKATAMVTHPNYQKQGIASKLVQAGCEELLSSSGPVNSIYTTTRTTSVGPQLVFLNSGFKPLGIFPNAHRLREYETLTLFARYKPGALDRRTPVEEVPEKLLPILSAAQKCMGIPMPQRASAPQEFAPPEGAAPEFEFIFAPEYVRRRFETSYPDPYDRFYPFHVPNLLIASKDGEIEIYAYFSRKDCYCTVIGINVPIYTLDGKLSNLLIPLREYGISYIEVLISLEYTKSLEALFRAKFLPSAVYPCMRDVEKVQDFVLMSRTLEPLNFSNMEIHRAFKPYVEEYVKLWKNMHLETLEVYDDGQAYHS